MAPASADEALLYGEGHLDAEVAFLPLPTEDVAALLPAGLKLAGPEEGWNRPGHHPVYLLFGEQLNVRPVLGDRPAPERLAWNYFEFIVGIPHVKFRDGSSEEEYAYMARLFLDHIPAIAAGKVYGFAKKLASISRNSGFYDTRSPWGGTHHFSAYFETRGPEMPLAELPNFDSAAPMFSLPLVGQTDLGYYVCSDFFWDLENARGEAVRTRYVVHNPFLPAFSVQAYDLPAISERPYGSFRMSIPWRLSAPRRCR